MLREVQISYSRLCGPQCPSGLDVYHLTPEPYSGGQGKTGAVCGWWEGGAAGEPVLRRPFSLHRMDQDAGIVEIIYQVRQRVDILTERRSGEELEVRPLGNGFSWQEEKAWPGGGGMKAPQRRRTGPPRAKKWWCSGSGSRDYFLAREV